jgi:hypothetical protein
MAGDRPGPGACVPFICPTQLHSRCFACLNAAAFASFFNLQFCLIPCFWAFACVCIFLLLLSRCSHADTHPATRIQRSTAVLGARQVRLKHDPRMFAPHLAFISLPPPPPNRALGMRSYIDESIARTRGIPGILLVFSFLVPISCHIRPQRLWRAKISATRRRQVQYGSCQERY